MGASLEESTVSMLLGMQTIPLWLYLGAKEANGCFNILNLYVALVRRVCWPIRHSDTLLIKGISALMWAGTKLQGNEISSSIELVRRGKHDMLGLDKTTMDNHRPMTKSSSTRNVILHLNLNWVLCLSTLPPDSWILITILNVKLPLFEKRNFDQWDIALPSCP